MVSTREALQFIRDANPGVPLTEDRVRHLLRRGVIPIPARLAGRLVWSPAEVEGLADALHMARPSREEPQHAG